MNLSGPMTLGDQAEIERRQRLLRSAPHSAPLAAWLDELAARRRDAGLPAVMPYIDPLEAGIEARVLLVLEAPGPMTNAENVRPGSGLISSDNADPTARNLWNARQSAGLIDGVLLWNAVPWYLGPAQRKPRAAERAAGAEILRHLIVQLPELHTVVPLGLHAQAAWARHGRPSIGIELRTIESWHPGGQAMNQPGKREALVSVLERAGEDWRPTPALNRMIHVDRDKIGNVVANWYTDADGDRVDIHPRWW